MVTYFYVMFAAYFAQVLKKTIPAVFAFLDGFSDPCLSFYHSPYLRNFYFTHSTIRPVLNYF